MTKLLNSFKIEIYFLNNIKYSTIGFIYLSICNLKEILKNNFILFETNNIKDCKNALLKDLILRWKFSQNLYLKKLLFNSYFKSLNFINS